MIRTISGTVTHHMGDGIVVGLNGIGYLVTVPARSVPRLGEAVELFTFHYIREEVEALYGFASAAELQMFQSLLTVPSIGPKLAMSILGVAAPADIVLAVETNNIGFFSALPGIGKKSAAKIIVELKGKITASRDVVVPGAADLVEALQSLGYSPGEIQPLLARLPSELVGTEAQVTWALRQLS